MSKQREEFPNFDGNTGGWLQAAEIEEKYACAWTADLENIFEMPTGGAAKMKSGQNLTYFAKKEQCLALAKQLRTSFKITNYKIFRLFPTTEIQFLHPKDGVFPEKVNEGRAASGINDFPIGNRSY